MKRVAIYIRVSTERQDMEGFSIPMQKDRLIAFCKARGWLIAGMYVDPGKSGSNLTRPAMEALIKDVKENKFDVVLVYKLDRLSRSQKDTLFLIEDIFLKNGTDFVSVQESFDTGTSYGRAMVGILSVFAQLERETLKERTLMGRSGRASDGLWHGGGTDAIGYDYVDGELVVNEAEAAQVQRVFELYAKGLTLTAISEEMAGYKTKHGGWQHTSTIGNVLDNPLYVGIIHFDGVSAPGTHDAIISEELFEYVKARREIQKSAGWGARPSEYLLTGMVYCGECGARYFVNRRPNGNRVYSCHSRAKKNRKMIRDPHCKNRHWPMDELETIVEVDLLRLAADPSQVDDLINKKRAALEEGGSAPDAQSEELSRIDDEINKLMDLYAKLDHMDIGEVADRIEALHRQKMEMVPVEETYRERSFHAEGAKLLLRDVLSVWGDLDVDGKRPYLTQLIDRINVSEGRVDIEWSFL